LLSFGAESFAFHFAIQKFKDKDIKNYSVALFFFCGCQISKEEPKLRLFESRVLRRIFGPKRDEVTENRRKLQNEESNELYSSPNIIRVIKSKRMRWAGHVARMGERIDMYRVSVGTHEGNRPLGRSRRRWEDNINMYLQKVGWGNGRD